MPAAKVTAEIAEARGVPQGIDVASPGGHSAFSNVVSLVAFVEQLADITGLPVGVKSAVGQVDFWTHLAQHMA